VLRQDLKRYSLREYLAEPAIWAIAVYRFGRWAKTQPFPLSIVASLVYFPIHFVVQLATGIVLPRSAEIGPGLRINHFGGIVIHHASVIGANCTMGHGVTVGIREEEERAPTIEDDVMLGAYAQILGPVRVGRGAKVGAMSVVLADIPPGVTAAGVPARVVGQRSA